MIKTKILIADDEPDILEFLEYNLEKAGYEVFTATDGQSALQVAQRERPQLIVLDIMMPVLDGIEVCRRLRENADFKSTLIIFLTARDEDYTQIAALDVGGDDYIAKPISPRVFVSRVNALLRRFEYNDEPKKTAEHIIQIANLEINTERFSVFRGNEEIYLVKKEFELLMLLIKRAGKVYTREEIFSKIWGNDVIVGDRTIDVHIRKLREKLGDDYIGTVKGIGYRFEK